MRVFHITILLITFFVSASAAGFALETGNETIIGGDDVCLRDKPGTGSNVIARLKLGHIVRVLKRNEAVETVGKLQGSWVYVDSLVSDRSSVKQGKPKTLKGWVFDYYIMYKSKFTMLRSYKPAKIATTYGGGDVHFEIIISEDAGFTMKDIYQLGGRSEHVKLCEKACGEYSESDDSCSHTGHLYRYNRIIWARLDNVSDGGNEYYLITDDGKLKYITNAGPDYWSEHISGE